MSDLLPFVVGGIVVGSIYGLAATGLVLTYKTSGVFNFAHGAVGAAGAFLFYELRDVRGVDPWVAMFVTVAIAAPLCGRVLARVAAGLALATPAHRIVGTVGLLLAVQGLLHLRFGAIPLRFDSPFPLTNVTVFDTNVGYDQLITIGIAVSALALLTVVFRRTRVGLQMRAVVDDSHLLSLTGVPPQRVRAVAWMVGSSFAAMTGILFAPTVGLDSLVLSLLVVQACGAAALGRFQSLALTFVGGIAIGVVQSLLRAPDVVDVVPFLRGLAGISDAVAFLVLFVVLVTAKQGAFGEHASSAALVAAPVQSRHGPWVRRVGTMVAVAVAVMLPTIASDRPIIVIQTAVFVTIFASLYLLVEISGQVSLCHAAFVAVGATTFVHVTTGLGAPWLVGALAAVAVVIPLGALIAIPSTRLSGLFLALATFGFGVVIERMGYHRSIMFGPVGTRYGSRPEVFGLGSDRGYYYLCLAVAMASIAFIVRVRRMRLGRLLATLADSPVALATHGASTTVTRTIVFCLAAGMAGLAGVLYVGVFGSLSSSGSSIAAVTSFNSLVWLAVLVISRRHSGAPVQAAVAMILIPSYLHFDHVAEYSAIVFGAIATIHTAFGERADQWLIDKLRRERVATDLDTDDAEPLLVGATREVDHA